MYAYITVYILLNRAGIITLHINAKNVGYMLLRSYHGSVMHMHIAVAI